MASFWNKVDQKIEAAVSNHQASPQATQQTNMENSAQTGDTKADDKSNGKEKANSLSVSLSHLQNWGCSAVLLTHISIYWIYLVDMVDLFFSLLFVSTSQAVYYSCFYLSFSAKPLLALHIKQYFSLNRQKYHQVPWRCLRVYPFYIPGKDSMGLQRFDIRGYRVNKRMGGYAARG